MRPAAASEVDGVAVAAQRLAVLLSAGIAPVTAWRYLASSDASSCRREATAAARAARAGDDVGGAVLAAAERGSAARQDAWAALVALWRVADVSGAPPASSLRSLAVSLRELGAVRRQVDVALAGPAATARMVLLMPAVAVLLGVALGFDTVTILLATPLGIACTVMAVGLIVVGARWNRRMVRRATPHERAPGLALELLAVALSGGVSVQRARSLVERSLPPRLQAVRDELAAARGILLIASSAGVAQRGIGPACGGCHCGRTGRRRTLCAAHAAARHLRAPCVHARRSPAALVLDHVLHGHRIGLIGHDALPRPPEPDGHAAACSHTRTERVLWRTGRIPGKRSTCEKRVLRSLAGKKVAAPNGVSDGAPCGRG